MQERRQLVELFINKTKWNNYVHIWNWSCLFCQIILTGFFLYSCDIYYNTCHLFNNGRHQKWHSCRLNSTTNTRTLKVWNKTYFKKFHSNVRYIWLWSTDLIILTLYEKKELFFLVLQIRVSTFTKLCFFQHIGLKLYAIVWFLKNRF